MWMGGLELQLFFHHKGSQPEDETKTQRKEKLKESLMTEEPDETMCRVSPQHYITKFQVRTTMAI